MAHRTSYVKAYGVTLFKIAETDTELLPSSLLHVKAKNNSFQMPQTRGQYLYNFFSSVKNCDNLFGTFWDIHWNPVVKRKVEKELSFKE